MPRTQSTYYVDRRAGTGEPWTVHGDHGFRFLGWAVSDMNRHAEREPELDWRVRTGPIELPTVHRAHKAGARPRGRARPTFVEAPRTMTVEQSWKRLPKVDEDDPL